MSTRRDPSAPAAGDRTRLRVGAWPHRLQTNSYNTDLYRHLSAVAAIIPVEADRAGLRAALRGEIDVLHLHWLDRVLWWGGRFASIRRMALLAAIAAAVRWRGGKVVWTAHDPVPHDMHGTAALAHPAVAAAWRLFERRIIRSLDGVLVLSASHEAMLRAAHPALATRPIAVTPHPHYQGVYPDTIDRMAARRTLAIGADDRVLVCIGSIRPYKGVLELLAAFREIVDPSLRLIVAGKLDGSDSFNRQVETAAAADPRVHTAFGYIPDDRLQLYFRAADIAALPFTSVTNSGSALLALSYDLPIIVPDEPVFDDLRAYVGTDFVVPLDLPLTAASLRAAIETAIAADGRPDLTRLGWPDVAAATAAFFHRVLTGVPRKDAL